MKKRQRIRNFFIILSFLFLPVTLFYFSPYLIVWGASQGIITTSFYIFTGFVLGSLFIGRAFCGWFMPCAGMQEILFQINNNKPKAGKLDYLKFIIWIPWITAIVVLFMLAGGYQKTDYFFHLEHGISVSNIYMYIPYYSVIFLFLFNSLVFGKRATCHYLCWMSPFMIMGRKISNIINLPSLRLKANKDQCINCKLCNKDCPMSLDVNNMVINENFENRECILCGKCVDVCPKNVINFYFGRLSKRKLPFSSSKINHKS